MQRPLRCSTPVAAVLLLITAALTGLALGAAGAAAQPANSSGKAKAPVAAAQAPAAPAAASAPTVALPDADKIVVLVRTTLLSFNDALQTGNFTVFRQRGSPNFQAANSPDSLLAAFASLKGVGVDFTGVAIAVPQLSAAPSIDAQNRLRISGSFPGQPLTAAFVFVFEAVSGQWRMADVAINLVPSQQVQATQPPAPVGKAGAPPLAAKKQ